MSTVWKRGLSKEFEHGVRSTFYNLGPRTMSSSPWRSRGITSNQNRGFSFNMATAYVCYFHILRTYENGMVFLSTMGWYECLCYCFMLLYRQLMYTFKATAYVHEFIWIWAIQILFLSRRWGFIVLFCNVDDVIRAGLYYRLKLIGFRFSLDLGLAHYMSVTYFFGFWYSCHNIITNNVSNKA